VLVVARNQRSFEYLKEQIRSRSMGRAYQALVEGTMVSPTGTIDAPIARDPAHPTKRAVAHGGKAARTHYEVVGHYPGSGCSLLSVRLDTGRTHQIRVHLAAIGHPVVGDWTYGASRRDLAAPRTFLHASRVDLTHPTTGEPMSIESPLPTDLTAVLAQLT
jgi:23S rRNA pseudouridine1911/1915/1917 synthase